MNKITDYKLCRAGTVSEFEKSVRNAVSEGWQPQGGPIVHEGILLQSLVRCQLSDGVGPEGIEMVPRKPGPAEEAL